LILKTPEIKIHGKNISCQSLEAKATMELIIKRKVMMKRQREKRTRKFGW